MYSIMMQTWSLGKLKFSCVGNLDASQKKNVGPMSLTRYDKYPIQGAALIGGFEETSDGPAGRLRMERKRVGTKHTT